MFNAQDYPQIGQPSALLIRHLLDRARTWAPRQQIVYRDLKTLTYLEFIERVHRLAHLLTRLGVRPGDRVGVMDWDSHRYLECFFAIPMIGAVLHTINVRLAPDQIAYTIRHAGDRVLLVHPDFHPALNHLSTGPHPVEIVVRLPDSEAPPPCPLPCAGDYETLLAAEPAVFDFPEFDEQTVATLFYTTGTTGEPKGVFFSHRQIVLHTLGVGLGLCAMRDPVPLQADDVYLPLTPMFHVHAWGIPYLATLLGLKQVYAGRFDPQMILQLRARHRVTYSHCVPTILQMLLHHPAGKDLDWNGWKIMTGGAALPKGLAREAMERGLQIIAGYGMSETAPIICVAQIKPEDAQADPERRLDVLTRTGFPLPLVHARTVDAEDQPLPPGPNHPGELVLRAPWLTRGYYRDPERSAALWRQGWLHTGDMAYLDDEGYIRITDRLKDVIKIGGEWISSLELESALSQHPAVREAAVIGVPDDKWGERPQAHLVLHDSADPRPTEREILRFLHAFIDRGAVHQRAILTRISFVDTIPRTSVGKINKRALRGLP